MKDVARFQDERTEAEKLATWGFIACTSAGFTSNQRVLIARPLKEANEYEVISEVMRQRSDLKRVRYVSGRETKAGQVYKPTLKEGERVYIHNFNAFLPQRPYCLHVGGRISHASIRGNILSATELAQGITDLTTEKCRALHLEEWRVSELLPDKDMHERDEYWQAFVIGDNIPKVLERLHIGTSGTNAEMVAMMQDYKARDVSYFISDEILDVELVCNLEHRGAGRCAYVDIVSTVYRVGYTKAATHRQSER